MFDDSRKVTDFSGTFRDAAKLAVESPYTTIDGVKVLLTHLRTFAPPRRIHRAEEFRHLLPRMHGA